MCYKDGFDMMETKVGDKLITRDGRVAEVLGINPDHGVFKWKLVTGLDHYFSVDEGGFQYHSLDHSSLDVIGKAKTTRGEIVPPTVTTSSGVENKGVKDDSKPTMMLTQNAAERKQIPVVTGLIDYFPLALAEVAKCSKIANEQHNPGSELHWDRTKSTDHIDCIGRHLIDRDSLDTDGVQHDVKLAWRALAYLQLRLENEKEKSK